jgi:hypothetical protein
MDLIIGLRKNKTKIKIVSYNSRLNSLIQVDLVQIEVLCYRNLNWTKN